ncbi:HEPN domain-containing protein [uncultured Alcanivorax sp.]|jgi:hypothetical protein|uniref:HEPN domain-containing protein n=1 Tax=uncultured Alcanivorax sp. TaxID=191215 RepID=UPI0025FE942E|nr:HEPN domain-containing protein [uncultured Alcanivorax sp.]
MPSQSFYNFGWNFEDVERLEIAHGQLNPDGQGRRALGHITRSAMVMLCAAWELYFEDLIIESVNYINSNLDDPHDLPSPIKKNIIKALAKDSHELAMFRLAGDGWKLPLFEMAEKDTEKLNTPKSEQLGVLCKNYLGIENISSEWSIGPDGINEIMTQRGEIAHRGRDAAYIPLWQLVEYKNKINLTVIETDNYLAGHLKDLVVSNTQPWRRKAIPEGLL